MQKATNISDSLKVSELGSAHAIYKQLELDREPFLEKAKLMASLSLPYICPPDEGQYFSTQTTRQDLPVPKNGIVPQGTKTLASKLVTTLFPTHIPYFRFSVSEAVLNEADELEKLAGGGEQYDENDHGPTLSAPRGRLLSSSQLHYLLLEVVRNQRDEPASQ